MSIVRSSSSVRNLRAVFENHERSQSRGRSPTGSPSASQSGHSPIPARKIRSSFVAVEPSRRKASATMSTSETLGQEEPTQHRRGSFSLSEQKDQTTIENMKNTVGAELSKRKSQPGLLAEDVVPEVAATSAVGTPIAEVELGIAAGDASDAVSGTKGQSEHPDKPISSIEDASASMQPSDVKEEATFSGVAETSSNKTNGDTSKRSSAAPAKGKTSATASKRLSTSTSTSANRRTSLIGGPSAPAARSKPRSPTRPVQLPSHLTAQTASSRAKHQPEEQGASKSTTATSRVSREIPAHLLAPTASSRAKHEEEPKKQTTPTKVREVPSHLLAPTAASRAKHEEAPKAEAPTAAVPAKAQKARTSLAPRQSLGPAATRTTRPAASRQSLANQTVASAAPPAKKSGPPSGDFLARMTRPTESSSSHKTSDSNTDAAVAKHDAKPAKVPVRPKPASRPSTGSKAATTTKARPAAETKRALEPSAVSSAPAPGSAEAAQPDPAISSEAVAEPTQEPVPETVTESTEVAASAEDKARVEAIAQAVESATEKEAAQALQEVQAIEPSTNGQAGAAATSSLPNVSEPQKDSLVADAALSATAEIESKPAVEDVPQEKSAAEAATIVEPVKPEIPVQKAEEKKEETERPEAKEPEAPVSADKEPELKEPEATAPAGKKSKKSKKAKAKAAAAAESAVEKNEAKDAEVEKPAAATAEPELSNSATSKVDEDDQIPEEFIPKDVTPAKPLSPVKAKPSGGGLMAASKYADTPNETSAPKETAPVTPSKSAEPESVDSAATPSTKPKEDDVVALQTPAFSNEVIH